MATYTTNFDLVKPAGSDSYDIDSFHNGSMDKIDSALQGLGSGMAIIAKNNTHAAVTSGQYVYVHGHGSLAEGLYKATANIAANGTLSGSNLSAVSNGLGGEVAALNSNIATKSYDTNTPIVYQKAGNSVTLIIRGTVTLDQNGKIGSLPTGYRPVVDIYFPIMLSSSNTNVYLAVIKTTGDIAIYNRGDMIEYAYGVCSYAV